MRLVARTYNERIYMQFLMRNVLIFVLLNSTCLAASPDFIIVPKQKASHGVSKNTLKEKLGQSTKQAINFTTELTSLMGKFKIGFADNAEKLCKISQLSQIQRNDGQIQINLSSIQSCFTGLVENLIDNKGYFKKASRGDLASLVEQMNEICDSLQCQVKKFEQLNNSGVGKKDQLSLVLVQFDSSAKELKEVQEKVKGLKCLKKS